VRLLSATEARKVLNISSNRMTELLVAGELPAFKEGRNWKITERHLEQYMIDRAERETERRKK